MYAKLMGVHICKIEGYDSLCLRAFPKENLIIMHYMLIAWWLHLLEGLGHYEICPRKLN